MLERTGLVYSIGAPDIPWGPTGKTVYERTYSRPLPDGSREDWAQTVARVVWGNLALVYGQDTDLWSDSVWTEAEQLARFMLRFQILPAGRHLWATGIPGRQYLFNCHVAGWSSLEDHVSFTLMRLAEGGGVGSNYSTKYLAPFGAPRTPVRVHVVCDPSHPDYAAMVKAGVLSDQYSADWPGAFEVEDTREGWADSITDLIDAAFRESKHADRVFDVSRVRWSGARLKTMGGTASGPLPLAEALHKIGRLLEGAHYNVLHNHARRTVRRDHNGEHWDIDRSSVDFSRYPLNPLTAMGIDHAIAEAIVAGGTRRSARMSIVHWADPAVFDFIKCKDNPAEHWSTNISVEIDDDFFAALGETEVRTYETGKRLGVPVQSETVPTERAKHAERVFREVVAGMLTNGEPGFWNSSLSNVGEPNEVIATNPCGEIALEPWENCNLGHVNMDSFVDSDGLVDMPALEQAHRLVTRFLIRATYGDVVDSKQAATLARNRRIGVGHFGVQGYVVKQGVKFSEATNVGSLTADLRHLSIVVDKAAAEYARELRIPVPVKTRTVAPTGSIAKVPGRTEGIHPIYARHFIRRVRFSATNPAEVAQSALLKDAGHHVEPDIYAKNTNVVSFITEDSLVAEVRAMGLDESLVESVDEISLADMLAFQRLYQTHWADNAVSFTVNIPAEPEQNLAMRDGYRIPGPSDERLNEVIATLGVYLPDLKGTTLMIDGSRPQAPYERLSAEQFAMYRDSGVRVDQDAGYDEDCASGACPVK